MKYISFAMSKRNFTLTYVKCILLYIPSAFHSYYVAVTGKKNHTINTLRIKLAYSVLSNDD